MSIYTYRINKSISEALGIEYQEIPELSDQELNKFEISETESIPGPKHCDETKLSISLSNKEYYKTDRGLKRRKIISERNKIIKSQEMKSRWEQNYEQLRELTKNKGRRKGCKDLRKRKQRDLRKVQKDMIQYNDVYAAASVHYKDNPNGAHYIRRMCRLQISGWKYND
jgi:hypothetical protein